MKKFITSVHYMTFFFKNILYYSTAVFRIPHCRFHKSHKSIRINHNKR